MSPVVVCEVTKEGRGRFWQMGKGGEGGRGKERGGGETDGGRMNEKGSSTKAVFHLPFSR